MNPILRNILAFIAACLVGGLINSGLVSLGPMIIPTPAGFDNSSAEGMASTFHLLESKHLIFPFLAHALGTLAGAFLVAKLAATRKMALALGIGFFFLLGGITAVVLIPAPLWFEITDLILAYIPMAWLGGKLAGGDTTQV